MARKSVKLNSILNALRMSLTVLVPLITFPYTSRIFLTEGNGKLSFSGSVVQVFILIASLGIYTYGVREGSKVRDSKEGISLLASELLTINAVATLLSYGSMLLLIFFVPRFNPYIVLILIYSLNIVFPVIGFDWVFGVYEDYTYITLRQILVQVFTIVTLFIFIHEPSDIYKWAAISTIAGCSANVFNAFYVRKYIKVSFSYVVFRNLRKHLQPILLLFATQIAATVYSNIDTLLLGIMATDHNTGLYSAAVKINMILITCFSAMTPVFMPRIVEYLKEGRMAEYRLFMNKILSLILAFSIPCVVGIECLSPSIISIIAGDAFGDAAITMRILGPIVILTACTNIFYYNVLVPSGKEKLVLVCTICCAGVNLVISMFLIPFMQENGAAIGSLVSELFALVVAISFSKKTDNSILQCLPKVANYLGGSLIVCCVCIAVNHLIANQIIKVILGIGISGVLYFLFLIIVKDIVGKEIVNTVKGIWLRIKNR